MMSVRETSALEEEEGADEEEGGQVRDGGHDHRAAHLHRLVPTALHVSGQICRRGHQPAPGRLSHNHPGRVPGNHAPLWVSNSPPLCGSLHSTALFLTTTWMTY